MKLGRKTRRRTRNPQTGTKWRVGPRDEKPRSMFRPTQVKHLPGGIDPPAKFAGSWQDRLLKRSAPRPRAQRQHLMPSQLWQNRRRRWQPKHERPTTSARAPGRRPTRLSIVQRKAALAAARRYGLARTMQRRAMTMRKIKEGGKFTRKRRRKQRTRRRRRKRNMRKRRKRRKTRK